MKSNENEEILEYKIIALGDSGVGKTSILKRFTHNKFDEDTLSTIGLAFAVKKMILKNNINVNLKLVDTGGQERYRALTKSYLKNTEGVLFVFAHNDKESFEHIEKWLEFFDENTDNINIPKLLIGNKNDLEKFEEKEESFKDFSKNHNISSYISTSAKTNVNITETFQEMANLITLTFNKSGKQKKKKLIKLKDKKPSNCFLCNNDL